MTANHKLRSLSVMITKRDITQQRGKKERIYDASFESIARDVFSTPGVAEASFSSILRRNWPFSLDESGFPSAVNNTFLSFRVRDKSAYERTGQ